MTCHYFLCIFILFQEPHSEILIKPVNLDAVIGITRDTCLRAAVRGRHTNIAQALLTAGADPNAPSNSQVKFLLGLYNSAKL